MTNYEAPGADGSGPYEAILAGDEGFLTARDVEVPPHIPVVPLPMVAYDRPYGDLVVNGPGEQA